MPAVVQCESNIQKKYKKNRDPKEQEAEKEGGRKKREQKKKRKRRKKRTCKIMTVMLLEGYLG